MKITIVANRKGLTCGFGWRPEQSKTDKHR